MLPTADQILASFNLIPGQGLGWRETENHWQSVADRLRIAADLAEGYAFYASEQADSEEDE